MPPFTTIPFHSLLQPKAYKLIISSILPRPIALISTLSPASITNLAPFSFFNGVSSNPPCLSVSIARKQDGTKKDTLRNIEASGEFVVNVTSNWFIESAVKCGAAYPYEESEFAATGLTPLPSVSVAPPRVAEAAIQFECCVYKLVEIGDGSPGSSTLVVGEIKTGHFSDAVYQNGNINHQALAPISRLGGISYGTIGDVFELKIPNLAAK